MPAKSEAQRRLFAAAQHGADFPKAREIRESMTPQQIADFTQTAPARAPHPAKNLAGHLKRPACGEICTEHRYRDRKR